jgi:hypothetical protein
MTKTNDTDNVTEIELQCYDQIMQVRRCVDALKDVYQNIPDDDCYSSVLIIIGERLEVEFEKLSIIALSNSKK